MRRDEFTYRGTADVPYIVKGANDVLDYAEDWAAWLADAGADSITSSSWTVPAGITQNNAARTSTKTTIWLSGGTVGATYRITNRIVTAGGRTAERSFDVVIQQQ